MSPRMHKQFKEVDSEKDVVAAATYLPLRHWWDVPAFLWISKLKPRWNLHFVDTEKWGLGIPVVSICFSWRKTLPSL